MRERRNLRWFALPVLALAAALPLGCGDGDQAHLEALAQYTPENLSEELVIRYQAAQGPSKVENRPSKSSSEKSKGGSSGREDKLSGLASNPHDDPGFAAARTADDVVQDIAAKAKTIASSPPAQVYEAIIKQLEANSNLSSSDKATLKTKLKKAMGV